MIILGINPGYDATAALLVDGQVVAVVEEERLSRKKMHLGFPRRAIQEVLRIARVDPGTVNCVTFPFVDYLSAHPLITRLLLEEKGFPVDPENALDPIQLVKSLARSFNVSDVIAFPKLSSKANYSRNVQIYLEELRKLGINVDRLAPVEHHMSHAASAYYFSGFDECLIVTADGCGDGNSLTVSAGKGGKINRLYQIPDTVSAGYLYASVTAFLGFKAHRHEGKITGLAAFGDPLKCYDHFIPCLKLAEEGHSLTTDFPMGSWLRNIGHFKRLIGNGYYRNPAMNTYDDYYQKHLSSFSREDIAAAVQKRLEDVLSQYLQPIIQDTGLSNLALAGGIFANVKLNQRLFELDGVDRIFVHPNMGDGGNALGSAFLAHLKHSARNDSGCTASVRLQDVYFGPEYSNDEIEQELKRYRFKYRYCDNIEEVIADKVARFQIVGRFNGRMEYGPRALGNRSILANPKDITINRELNKRLRRTEFMPFAPSVLYEDAPIYFGLNDGNLHAAEFMTITCNVHLKQRELIPAVCHVDGTARPHVVHKSVNPSFYKAIQAFKQRTGLGVIINTSFNIHEEPIVCTPADACIAFQQNSVDTLAVGDFIVER